MPRAFDPEERTAIESRIRAAGREQFGRVGLRKTTVSDLARAAGVAKGSFYLFFPSKEALLSSILQEEEADLRREVREQMSRPYRSARDRFAHFLRLHFEGLDTHPLLRMLRDPHEMEALFRRLPPDALDQAQADDDAFFMQFIAQWQTDGALAPHSTEAMEGLGRALRALNLHRDLIGETRFTALTDLLVDGLAEALCPDSGSH
jgi:AcrR family transcriptional regulator